MCWPSASLLSVWTHTGRPDWNTIVRFWRLSTHAIAESSHARCTSSQDVKADCQTCHYSSMLDLLHVMHVIGPEAYFHTPSLFPLSSVCYHGNCVSGSEGLPKHVWPTLTTVCIRILRRHRWRAEASSAALLARWVATSEVFVETWQLPRTLHHVRYLSAPVSRPWRRVKHS